MATAACSKFEVGGVPPPQGSGGVPPPQGSGGVAKAALP